MCGRYTLTSEQGIIQDLEASLDPETPQNEWWKPRFNVSPTQPAPVVLLRDGTRLVKMMRWGLVPFWAGRPAKKAPPLMINARVESIESKPVFRDALARKRCLVPADGFFEWKRSGKHSTPLYIHPEPRHLIAFAGLWARAKTEEGELYSFTIVTGPANELVAPIHDRMPVVLDRSAWAAWLDPSLDATGAHALLGVPAVADWRAETVSTWVNTPNHDDPHCIEPAEPEQPAQRSLFD
jgi:putative SOS response-associated peptidase YedK